ncbi:hypothetical protein [Cellvibrio polysaccharolyticus]|uniref:Type II secretion system protein GspC N-terminal domain-containing protein n=1 Tax=Cellvibrio polysaccharolyticus TaxID=2082724 RepID=A0A928V840_9GAMM|nr:hypothetical protein [Cellvibrio polysaccharolyticus]MBE8718865.1 hypothetical protein [Cellvibrio polysaccharolyticus]
MNAEFIKRLSIYQRVKLVAAMLAGLLVLLLIIGAVWAATLPPAPIVHPSPEALQATPVILSADDVESHYLDGLVPVVNSDTDVAVSQEASEGAEGFSLMASRPLFWAGRRPVIIDASEIDTVEDTRSSAKANELDNVELSGVYFAGDASGVIVRLDGKRMRVALGEELMGWKLKSVDGSEVRFVSADQEKTIQLEHAGVSDYTPAASRMAPSSAGKPASNRAQEP